MKKAVSINLTKLKQLTSVSSQNVVGGVAPLTPATSNAPSCVSACLCPI